MKNDIKLFWRMVKESPDANLDGFFNDGFDFNTICWYWFSYYTPISYLVSLKRWDMLAMLCDKGVRIRETIRIYPLLELTTLESYTEKQFDLLLNMGASINETDERGNTAFLNVCYDGNLDILKYLYKNGANIHATNKDGINGIYKFFAGGSYTKECFIWLLKLGVSIDLIDSYGQGILDRVKFNYSVRKYYPLFEKYVNRRITKEELIDVIETDN